MEIHRLKPMKTGYDVELFNKLYQETENLRQYLSYQINPRKYGVTQDIIKSWFDDKFIFVFNKYYGVVSNDQLKGYIINSLKTFKFRVLRKAYIKENIYENVVHLDGLSNLVNILPEKAEITDHTLFLEMALKYLKKNLSDDAFLVLQIELNPPPYILDRIPQSNKKIPAKLIAEYLGIEKERNSIGYINDLRHEVQESISGAKEFFKN